MKKLFFITLTSFALLASTGCKKKKTEETATDPCANTVCLNGGTCVDGSCACPTGYSGADCGTQKTPTKITITGIKLTKYPSNNNGSAWDGFPATGSSAFPDLILKLSKAGTNLFTSSELSNFSAANYTWDNTNGFTPIDITDVVSQYGFELTDKDTPPIDNDDSMGSINFPIYDSNNKFPAKILVGGAADALNFELTVTYTY